MSIFVVISQPTSPATALPESIARHFAERHWRLNDGAWLVAGGGTARDISKTLGLTDQADGAAAINGVVTEVGSYFGRANPEIWSWIKANWEVANGTP